jgi:hypothetical protein
MHLQKSIVRSVTFLVLYSLVTVFIGTGTSLSVKAQDPSASQPVNGVLTLKGSVTLNGIDAVDSTVVFSDSRLETKEDSSASVKIPGIGIVDIGCSSVVKVSYGRNQVEVTVISGYARLVANKGVEGTLMWSGGKPRRTDPSMTTSTVDSGVPNVCAPAAARNGGLWGLGTAGTALLLGGGGAVAVAIIIATHGPPCDRLPSQAVSNVRPCNQ